jgi:molecular chaperone HtpG
VGTFVKYGMLTEEKFNEKAEKFTLFKNIEDEFFTLEEYKEKVKDLQTDKHDKVVYIYTNNPKEQYSFIEGAKSYGYDILVMDNVIDNHYMQHLEQKQGATFVRVDSDTVDNLVQKEDQRESVLSEKEQEKIKTLFEESLGDLNGGYLELKPLSPDAHPVLITRPEFMRRMMEMQAMNGMTMANMPDTHNVVVNINHPLIAEKLLRMKSAEKKNDFANYLHKLALLNQNMLKGEELSKFINKSIEYIQ